MPWLAVAIGGALGSLMRYALATYLSSPSSDRFPLATFVVNILGSLAIGILYVVLVEKATLSVEWRLFFMTGLLGGFTTFSAFSLELLQLWQAGQVLTALVYASSSVILGLVVAFLGMTLAQRLF